MSEITNRIRSRGYWEISIRPSWFDETRIALDQLEDTVLRAVVRMRGWPIPMFDQRVNTLRGTDWIGQDIDARTVDHLEAWRLFTSGMFTQIRVVSADWRVGADATPVPPGAQSVIEIWEILFYLTELIEFAARISLGPANTSSVVIDVGLHKTALRQLVAGRPERAFHETYIATLPDIEIRREFEREELIARSREIAIDITKDILFAFGFDATNDMLSDYQLELTEYQ